MENIANENRNLNDFIQSEDIKSRIGVNVDYYVNSWKKITQEISETSMDDKEVIRKISSKHQFNLGAFVFGGFWAAWRGVPGAWAAIILVSVIQVIVEMIPETRNIGVRTGLGVALPVIFGFYGNAMYLVGLVKSRNDSIESVKPSYVRAVIALIIVGASIYAELALSDYDF